MGVDCRNGTESLREMKHCIGEYPQCVFCVYWKVKENDGEEGYCYNVPERVVRRFDDPACREFKEKGIKNSPSLRDTAHIYKKETSDTFHYRKPDC